MQKKEKNSNTSLRPKNDIKNQMSNLKENDKSSVTDSGGSDKLPSKRVSFASSNSVKQFVEDPDRFTIWGSSYEETISSDTTPSSESSNNSHKIPMDYVLRSACPNTSINFNINGGEDMECDLTILDNDIDKENCKISVTRKNEKVHSQNVTVLSEIAMDITTQSTAKNASVTERSYNKKAMITSAVDLTLFEIREQCEGNTNLNNSVTDEVSLEYTCQIPVISNHCPIIEHGKSTEDSESMEITEGVCFNTQQNEYLPLQMTLPSQQNLPLTDRITNIDRYSQNKNKSTRDSSSLEFTCEIPLMVIKNIEKTKNKEDVKVFQKRLMDKQDDVIPFSQKNDAFSKSDYLINNISNNTKTANDFQNCQREDTLKFDRQCEELGNLTKVIVSANADSIKNWDASLEAFKDKDMIDFEEKDYLEVSSKKHVLNNTTTLQKLTSETITITDLDSKEPSISMSNKDSVPVRSNMKNKTSGNDKSTCVKTGSTEKSGKLSNPLMNCVSLSLCTDDTQHLINCNLSNQHSKSDFSKIITGDLNPSFINSNLMALSSFSSDIFPISLETTHEVKYNKGLGVTYSLTNSNAKLDATKTTALQSSSQTKIIETDATGTYLTENDCTELRISQENLILSESVVTNNSTLPLEISAQELSKPASSILLLNKIKQLKSDWLMRHEAMDNFISNFGIKIKKTLTDTKEILKEFEKNCNEEVQVMSEVFKEGTIDSIESSSDYSLSNSSITEQTSDSAQNSVPSSSNVDFTLNLETFEEQIREKYKRKKKYWKILALEDSFSKIETLFKTIILDTYLSKDTGIVNKLDIHNKISDESESIARLVNQIFIERLKEKNLHSAIGEKYDILSLLDYVELNMQKILDILKDYRNFELQYNCKMDKNFRAKFYIINLINTWCIEVDMSDLDNIGEHSITVTAVIGSVNEKKIMKFLNNSFKGLNLLKHFLTGVRGYSVSMMQSQFNQFN